MSADNWALCPRCNDRAKAEYTAALAAVMESYCRVPVEAFDAARERVGEWSEIDHAFREDYEFYGAEDGTIVASYGGECQTCGLTVSFTHEHPFYSNAEAVSLEDAPARKGTGI